MSKPFSESAEQNKYAISGIIRENFINQRQVLELASGTGQHVVYFAKLLPHLVWQPSELPENVMGVKAWVDEASLFNVKRPLVLDVESDSWPVKEVDAVFSANSVHMMSMPTVMRMFQGIGRVLATNGLFLLYGPFNYGGRFTSESNALFDEWLKSINPEFGVPDFEAIDALAAGVGLELVQDFSMPANNRCLLWRRSAKQS